MSMLNDIEEVFFNKDQLEEIAANIGKQISEDFKDKNLLLVSVLKGSIVFMADLMRHITIPCKIDFITASSYHGGDTESSGEVMISDLTIKDVRGYDILVVEDIFDTGRTLQRLSDFLLTKGAASVTLCTLLDKPDRRAEEVKIIPQYIGAKVKNEFVVGYGLDYDQNYRNLPFIGILKSEIHDKNKQKNEQGV